MGPKGAPIRGGKIENQNKMLISGHFPGYSELHVHVYLHCTCISSTRTPCTLHCNLSPPIRISTHLDTYMYASLLALSHS